MKGTGFLLLLEPNVHIAELVVSMVLNPALDFYVFSCGLCFLPLLFNTHRNYNLLCDRVQDISR